MLESIAWGPNAKSLNQVPVTSMAPSYFFSCLSNLLNCTCGCFYASVASLFPPFLKRTLHVDNPCHQFLNSKLRRYRQHLIFQGSRQGMFYLLEIRLSLDGILTSQEALYSFSCGVGWRHQKNPTIASLLNVWSPPLLF